MQQHTTPQDNNQPESLGIRLSIRLTPSDYLEVRQYAKRKKSNVSEVLRIALASYMKRISARTKGATNA